MKTEQPEKKIIDPVKIGLRIKHVRIEKGMSQEQLADMVCCGTNYISSLETGRSRPSLNMLLSLSKALDVCTNYLLTGDPDIIIPHALDPEMEKRSRDMTPTTRSACLIIMDRLLDVQNSSHKNSSKV